MGDITENAVEVRGLRKQYGEVTAVDGLDLTIRRGEVFGLLGPNGAGKSTTVEILQGHRARDGGEVSVLGADPARAGRAWRSRVRPVWQWPGPRPRNSRSVRWRALRPLLPFLRLSASRCRITTSQAFPPDAPRTVFGGAGTGVELGVHTSCPLVAVRGILASPVAPACRGHWLGPAG
ncbi:ATP-binding cassette domain-containing protein [Streptomyces sp. NBC_01244]|uniref:ATP-binding cassette domain-containing protein n=1 Tax=Streptomyces sp. NBC_01244 TaxID=2903797 RepID=UPI003FA3B464